MGKGNLAVWNRQSDQCFRAVFCNESSIVYTWHCGGTDTGGSWYFVSLQWKETEKKPLFKMVFLYFLSGTFIDSRIAENFCGTIEGE